MNNDLEQIEAYLSYGYTPFRKVQCVERIIGAWVASAVLLVIGERSVAWAVPLGLCCLLITALFITLTVRHSKERLSRYLCDGVFSLYLALLLDLAAFRITVLQSGVSLLRAAGFVGLLLLSIAAWGLLVRKNIKSGRYSEAAKPQKVGAWAYIGGALGVLAAPVLLAGRDGLTIASVGLIFVSLLLSAGSLNLQRALLDIKMQRREPG